MTEDIDFFDEPYVESTTNIDNNQDFSELPTGIYAVPNPEESTIIEESKIIDSKDEIIDQNKLSTDIINVFNKIYKEENLSIEIEKEARRMTIIVLYPEILIKSTYNEEHIIRDLYVIYTFNISYYNSKEDFVSMSSIQGIRGKCTLDEYLAGYNHSHLGNSILCKGGFCFGYGDISNVKSSVTVSAYSGINDIYIYDLYTFLLSMEEFLKIESSNTNPYKYISSIGNCNIYMENSSSNIPADYFKLGAAILFHILEDNKLREEFVNKCIITTDKEVLVDSFEVMEFINSFVDFDTTSLNSFNYDPITFEFSNRLISISEHFTKEGVSKLRDYRDIPLFKGNIIELKLVDSIESYGKYRTVDPKIISAIIHNVYNFIKDLKYEPKKFRK